MTIKDYQEEWKYITNVCLNLTNNCNLQCKYCFVEQKPQYMSLDTAINIINYLHNNLIIKKEKFNYPNNTRCRISFFGGEPTLLFDEIIVPITNYINQQYKDEFWLSITTNGTLLNKDRIKFLKDNNIEILLSLDGDKLTQDTNRPSKDKQSSFDKIMNILPDLQNAYPELGMRATIYEETVNELFNNYLFAIKNHFFFANFIPDERHAWSEQSLQILQEEIKKIFLFHIEYFLRFHDFPIHINTIEGLIIQLIQENRTHINTQIMKDIDFLIDKNEDMPENIKKLHRCGLGTVNGSIDYNGNIYGCQEQDSKNDHFNIFLIGDIYNGVDVKKHLELLNLYENQNSKILICEDQTLCEHCNRKQFCYQDICPSLTYDLFSNFYTANKVHCVYRQSIHLNTLALLQIIGQNTEACTNFTNFLLNSNSGLNAPYGPRKRKEVNK